MTSIAIRKLWPAAIKAESGGIATRLKRDRSAVKRDVDYLEQAGLVTVKKKSYPGQSRLKEVRAVASNVVLEAVFA